MAENPDRTDAFSPSDEILDAGLAAAFGQPPSSVLRALAAQLPEPPCVHLHEPDSGAASPVVLPDSDQVPEGAGPESKYQLHGEIARGGMGAVLKGRDTDLGRDVAVKVLLEQHAGRTELLHRFIEEAQIAGQLQHPGIVPVYEMGRMGGRPFFSMKLVKGQTLAKLLEGRADPSQDQPRLLQVFEQVCHAMAYAHARGVIHRDLKPANVMAGGYGEVLVMDWGLAKVLRRGGTADEAAAQRQQEAATEVRTARSGDVGSDTQAGSVLGTPAYMAPEQARGQVDLVDERADVFGLGAILCEILTGQPPFTGRNPEAARKAQTAALDEAYQRLRECGADAGLIELCRRCLAAEPWQRPRDAAAVAEAVGAHRRSVAERLRQAELQRAAAEAQAREERKRRRVQLALAAAVLAAVVLAGGGGWLWQKRRADLRNDVEAALTAAADHRDAARWEKARRSLEYAEERLGQGGAADLRDRLAQAQADLNLAEELDSIRLRKAAIVEGQFHNVEAANREYERAFRNAGLGGPGDDVEAVAARVRGSAIRVQLLAVLDDWAAWTWEDQGRLAWLLAVARQADDPRHARFRDPKAWGNEPALRRLAEEALAADVPPSLLAAIAWQLGDKPDNLPPLHAVVARHPTDFWAHFWLANALYKESPKEAVGFYWAALALRPRTAVVHNDLGNALRGSGDLRGAIASYRRAIECDPKDATPHHNLGISLRQLKDLKGAIASFRRALECNPRDALAHTNLGIALHDSGDVKGAIASYRRAIEADPKLAVAHGALGALLRDSGRFAEAVSATRGCLQLLPADHPERPFGTRQLQQCEALLALDQKLTATLQGKQKPNDAAELLSLADLCLRYKKRHAAAARFYADAFAARPGLASDLSAGHRYDAACAAVLAAAGEGIDAAKVGDRERRSWRAQAYVWLKADLAARSRQLKSWWPGEAAQARKALTHWLKDSSLACVREPAALAWMPAVDALAWTELWADVAALLKRAESVPRSAYNNPG